MNMKPSCFLRGESVSLSQNSQMLVLMWQEIAQGHPLEDDDIERIKTWVFRFQAPFPSSASLTFKARRKTIFSFAKPTSVDTRFLSKTSLLRQVTMWVNLGLSPRPKN